MRASRRKIETVDGVGVSLESFEELSTFMIPNLDEEKFVLTEREGEQMIGGARKTKKFIATSSTYLDGSIF